MMRLKKRMKLKDFKSFLEGRYDKEVSSKRRGKTHAIYSTPEYSVGQLAIGYWVKGQCWDRLMRSPATALPSNELIGNHYFNPEIYKAEKHHIHDYILEEFLNWTHRNEGTIRGLARSACHYFDDYPDPYKPKLPNRYLEIAEDIYWSFEDQSEERE